MLLEVVVNGRPFCRAGVEAGVVSAFVNLLQIESPEPADTPPRSASLVVNGFMQGETREPEDQTAVQWGELPTSLQPGDVVVITVVDDGAVDEPTVTPLLPDLDEDEVDDGR